MHLCASHRRWPGLLVCAILSASAVSKAYAGAWTLPRDHVWGKVTFMRQATSEEYVAVGGGGRGSDPTRVYGPGDRAPYRFNGRYSSYGVFLDLSYGLNGWLDVGAQIPYFDQNFSDSQDAFFLEDRGQKTLSDVRTTVKVRLTARPIVFSVGGAAKVPTGKFRNRDGLITVADGQWDFDLLAQAGRSFWPVPAYANVDIGYRIRLKNREVDRDPGDEWTFTAEAGVHAHPKVLTMVKMEGIRGRSGRSLGVLISSDIRRITYLSPSVMVGPFANLSAEAGIRISLNGRNYPAGKMFVAGLSYAGKIF